MELSIGTATLMRLPSQRQQLRVLDAALDLGIRHIDTAPLYGFGAAERLLGLRSSELRSAGAEVTTKVGLSAPQGLVRLNRLARPVRFALRRSRALTKAVRARGGSLSQPTELNWAEVERSLVASRDRLRVDRLDAVLLHERAAEELSDALVAAWTQQMADHASRNGVAAKGGWVPLADRLGGSVSIVQVADWAAFEGVVDLRARRVHGALKDVGQIVARLDDEPAARVLLEEASDMSLRSTNDIAEAVVSLHGATGLVDQLVVGSTSTAHWRALASAASEPVDLGAAEAMRILSELTTPGRPTSAGPPRS